MGSLTAGIHFAPFFFFISNASLGCDTESGWHKMRSSERVNGEQWSVVYWGSVWSKKEAMCAARVFSFDML